MATHININRFKTEPWFNEIKSNIIDTITDYNNKDIDLEFYLVNIAFMEVIQFLNIIHIWNMI